VKRVLAILLVVLTALSAAGCGAKSGTPQGVFEQYMKALQKGRLEDATALLTEDASTDIDLDMDPNLEGVVKTWLSKMEYKVTSVQEEGDVAEVRFTISAPDLKKVSEAAWQEMSEERQQAVVEVLPNVINGDPSGAIEQKKQELLGKTYGKMQQKLADPKVPTVRTSGKAELTKTESGWKISALRWNRDLGL